MLAHPSHRDAANRVDPQDLCALDGVEIWNVKNGNKFFPTVSDAALLQRVRAEGRRPTFAYAGLDWHHLNKFTPLVLRVDTESLTADHVLRCLRTGAFTIESARVTVRSTGEIGRARAFVYGAVERGLKNIRRVGYRWQSSLERRGFKSPRFIIDAARRFF